MNEDMKNLLTLTLALVSSFVLFIKAQFKVDLVPEFNDFSVVAITFIFTVVGIWLNNRKPKKKKSSK